jgi:hypothetical protein
MNYLRFCIFNILVTIFCIAVLIMNIYSPEGNLPLAITGTVFGVLGLIMRTVHYFSPHGPGGQAKAYGHVPPKRPPYQVYVTGPSDPS